MPMTVVSMRVFWKMRCSSWNKDHVLEDIDPTIGSYDNGGDDGEFGDEIAKSLVRFLQTSKWIWKLNYQMHPIAWKMVMLDWNFNSTCLSSWILWIKTSSVAMMTNQQDKMIKLLILQDVRRSSSTTKLAQITCQIFSWDFARQVSFSHLTMPLTPSHIHFAYSGIHLFL